MFQKHLGCAPPFLKHKSVETCSRESLYFSNLVCLIEKMGGSKKNYGILTFTFGHWGPPHPTSRAKFPKLSVFFLLHPLSEKDSKSNEI